MFLVALVVVYLVGRVSVMDNATVNAQDALRTIISKAEQVALEVEYSVNELGWHIVQCEKEEQVVGLSKHLLNSLSVIQSVAISVDLTTADLKMASYVYRDNSSLRVDDLPIKERYVDQPWYSKPMKTQEPTWCAAWQNDRQGSEKRMVCYSIPIRNENDSLVGVCCVNIYTDWVAEAIESLRTYKDAEITITTNDGYEFITAESDDGVNTVRDRQTLIFSEKALAGRWQVSMICPKDEVLTGLVELNFMIGIVMIVGLVLLYIVIRIVVGRITAPLRKFDVAARNVAKGEFDNKLPRIKSRDELYTLCRSISFMQDSLKEYVEQLRITTARKERIENELTIAADIQKKILNSTFPRFNDFDMYATLAPARQVGGDLYDHYTNGDKMWFVVGDVSGKGIPASMYMSVVVFIFRTIVRQTDDVVKVVTAINDAVSAGNTTSMFITMIVGVIDTKTSQIEICNAGHNPPILKNRDGTHYLKQEPNIALGVVADFEFVSAKYHFDSNSELVLYTDGATESRNINNVEFGERALLELVRHSESFNPRLTTDQIMRAVERHRMGAEQSDDIAILVVAKYETTRELLPAIGSVALLKPFIESLPLGDRVSKFRLAVEELVVNSIQYSRSQSPIWLSAIATPTQVVLYVEDRGVAFNPLLSRPADVESEIQDREIGGLGIFLAQQMTDRMVYDRVGGMNILTLICLRG